MFSLFLIMSQPFAGTARRPRLAPSVLATSALALTALAGGVILSGGGAKAAFFCNPSGINGPQVLPILKDALDNHLSEDRDQGRDQRLSWGPCR